MVDSLSRISSTLKHESVDAKITGKQIRGNFAKDIETIHKFMQEAIGK